MLQRQALRALATPRPVYVTRGLSSARLLCQENADANSSNESSTKKLMKIVESTKNTLNFSEDTRKIDLEAVSGAPKELATNRIVRIFKESKPATQSGDYQTRSWRIDWDIIPRANRWENDMMGWASSGDYMQATRIKFTSREDAIRFASNNGWDFYVQEPHQRAFRVKSYATNFLYSPDKLKHIRTK